MPLREIVGIGFKILYIKLGDCVTSHKCATKLEKLFRNTNMVFQENLTRSLFGVFKPGCGPRLLCVTQQFPNLSRGNTLKLASEKEIDLEFIIIHIRIIRLIEISGSEA